MSRSPKACINAKDGLHGTRAKLIIAGVNVMYSCNGVSWEGQASMIL